MGFTEKKRLVLFGLPWTFTSYHIEEDILTIDEGFLKKRRMTVTCTGSRTWC